MFGEDWSSGDTRHDRWGSEGVRKEATRLRVRQMTSGRLGRGRMLPSFRAAALTRASGTPDLVELKVLSVASNEFWKLVGCK